MRRGRETLRCWIEGVGWKPYPIMVPRPPKFVRWEVVPEVPVMVDARDYITTVWIGPEAPFPRRWTHV
jgi:hypothetical protein